MSFEECLKRHIASHPLLECRDIIKFCYQAMTGSEHILKDIESAKSYFFSEYENTPSADISLYEELGDVYCRVNFAAWKNSGLEASCLFELFIKTAGVHRQSEDTYISEYFDTVSDVLTNNRDDLTADWRIESERYLKEGVRPLHHSDTYRNIYRPAYRVVSTELLKEKLKLFFGEND